MRIDFASCTAVVVLSLWLILHEVECRLCQQCGDTKYTDCVHGVVEATQCEDNQLFCVIFAVAIDKDKGPFIARSCTNFNGTSCRVNSMDDGQPVVICRTSCETDGCNQGKFKMPQVEGMLLNDAKQGEQTF